MVGDFAVKYVKKENTEPLAAGFHDHYKIPEDWKGPTFIGLAMCERCYLKIKYFVQEYLEN